MDETDELADLTARLVAIPSHEDETAAGDAIESWLRAETDATVERDAVGNVVAYKGSRDCGSEDDGDDDDLDEASHPPHTFALVGHHDVVPPAEGQTTGEGTGGEYVVERRDGRIHGRGAADMKGAIAACLLAFRDATPPPGRELAVASVVGEEVGGEGARHAIDEGFVPEYALVAEGSTDYSKPGVTDVAVAHKGRRASTLVATGEAAHASEPEAGENAIYRACDAVDVVRTLDPPEATVFDEPYGGRWRSRSSTAARPGTRSPTAVRSRSTSGPSPAIGPTSAARRTRSRASTGPSSRTSRRWRVRTTRSRTPRSTRHGRSTRNSGLPLPNTS